MAESVLVMIGTIREPERQTDSKRDSEWCPSRARVGESVTCKSCMSPNQREFASETNIHCSSLENIEGPSVLVFPRLLVCTDCGFTEFAIAKADLELLTRDESSGETSSWRKTA